MLIGERLRELRKAKNLSQVYIEKRVGLRKCYISRVEHGYTVPQVETLKKFAIALEVPLSEIFNQGECLPALPRFLEWPAINWSTASGKSKEARYVAKLIKTVARISEPNKRVLLSIAQKMAKRGRLLPPAGT